MREAKRKIIGIMVFVGLILYSAFSAGGFLTGMRTLGEIVIFFGLVFVKLFNAVFSIPEVAQEITKRVITTLLVLCAFGVGLRGQEENLLLALWVA